MLFVAILVGLLAEGGISVFGLSNGGGRRLGLVSGNGATLHGWWRCKGGEERYRYFSCVQ